MRKPFNPDLYAKHNQPALDALAFCLDSEMKIDPKDEDFGVDADILLRGELYCHIELEVKPKWDTGPFPWEEINFLARKIHLMNTPKPCFWMV